MRPAGKVAPYGVHDVSANEGFVSVVQTARRRHDITADTAEFAVQSIRTWRERMGRPRYPDMHDLTITADGGGSNGTRSYAKGIKVSDAEMASLEITGDDFHPEWNYTIKPRQPET